MGICIHHDGALGDALLSLACIRSIARGLGTPDWIGRADVGKLLSSLGMVGEAYDAGGSRLAQWHASCPDRLSPDLLARYDRVFVFTVRPESELVQNIRAKVPDTRVIVTVPQGNDRTHVAEFRMRQFPQELRSDDRSVTAVTAAMREQARDVLARTACGGPGPVIALHSGSGGKRKCWPLERYFALADGLASRHGASIAFLVGPAEEGEIQASIEGFVQERAGMGCISGRELPLIAGLLAHSTLYIGNDSGVTHLAAAVGAPVIALFGPTDPALWAPRGAHVRVLAAGALEDISADDVLGAAAAAVADGSR